jgi:serine phosphatase RsbU (regulator of sigma subunit)
LIVFFRTTRADGTTEEVGAPGTLLGLVPEPHLEDRSIELQPADTLLLYTGAMRPDAAPA